MNTTRRGNMLRLVNADGSEFKCEGCKIEWPHHRIDATRYGKYKGDDIYPRRPYLCDECRSGTPHVLRLAANYWD